VSCVSSSVLLSFWILGFGEDYRLGSWKASISVGSSSPLDDATARDGREQSSVKPAGRHMADSLRQSEARQKEKELKKLGLSGIIQEP
jgi:hypothetical protein